jgi:hypothetical protein
LEQAAAWTCLGIYFNSGECNQSLEYHLAYKRAKRLYHSWFCPVSV